MASQRSTKPDKSPLEQEIRDSFKTRKRVFIGLITGSSVLICLFLALMWIIPFVGLTTIHPAAPWIFGIATAALILTIGWAALALVLNILLGRPVLFAKRLRGITVKLFLPLMTLLGRAVGIPKQTVRASWICATSTESSWPWPRAAPSPGASWSSTGRA